MAGLEIKMPLLKTVPEFAVENMQHHYKMDTQEARVSSGWGHLVVRVGGQELTIDSAKCAWRSKIRKWKQLMSACRPIRWHKPHALPPALSSASKMAEWRGRWANHKRLRAEPAPTFTTYDWQPRTSHGLDIARLLAERKHRSMETGDKPQGLMAKLWARTTPPTPEQRQRRQENIKHFEEWKANYPKVDARRAKLIAQMKEAERDFLLYLETHEDDRYFDEHQSHYVGVTEQCEDELFEITKPYWEPDEPEPGSSGSKAD